jgi:hypothetical protein
VWMSCLPAVMIWSIVRVWSSSSMAMPHPSKHTYRGYNTGQVTVLITRTWSSFLHPRLPLS